MKLTDRLLLLLLVFCLSGEVHSQVTYQLSSPTYEVIEGSAVQISLSRSSTDTQLQTVIVVLQVCVGYHLYSTLSVRRFVVSLWLTLVVLKGSRHDKTEKSNKSCELN